MAILDVLRFPDERSGTVAAPVEAFTPELQHIVDDMFETMYAEEGIGLAATQVDIHQRIIVIDVSENREEQLVLINPEILEQSGSTGIEEGCPPCPATVLWFRAPSGSRSGRKIATATPSSWKRTICSPSAYKHEMDHLVGKLFVDYLSPLKRQRIRQKLEKMAREDRKVLWRIRPLNKLKLILPVPDFAARHLAALLSSATRSSPFIPSRTSPPVAARSSPPARSRSWRWPTICRSINPPPCAMKRRRPNWLLWAPI